MDYIDGPGVYIPGTWATASIAVDNCWLYTNSADTCIWAKNVTNLLVTNCPMIYSTNDHGLYFDSVCNGVTISNNYLYAPYTGKSGVLVANVRADQTRIDHVGVDSLGAIAIIQSPCEQHVAKLRLFIRQ